MNLPLSLRRIEVSRFGGWSGRTLDLPDHPLVVIHGANESGKSTLAELITWLLVGPSGTAASAQRFGEPGSFIGGTLSGRLGETDFLAEGRFRVLRSGAPNDNGLTVQLDRSLSAADWRSRLGGVDPQVFSAIYRLWGEQLHEGEGVADQLAQVALGALGSAVDVRALTEQLASEVGALTKSAARDAESVEVLRRQIAEIDRRAVDARGNADRHQQLSAEHTELEQHAAALASEINDLQIQRTFARQILDLRPELDELTAARMALMTSEEVPAAWEGIAADPVPLEQAVAALSEAAEQLAEATPQAGEALARVGLDDAAMSVLNLGVAEATAIATAVVELRSARDRAATLSRQLESAQLRTQQCAADLGAAVAAVPGLTADRLPQVRLGASERAAVAASIAAWEAAERAARESEQAAELATTEVRMAEHQYSQATEAWERYGTGQRPEQFLIAPVAGAGTRRFVRWWWSPLLVLAVAVVAGALGQWAVAGAAVAVAVLVGLVGYPGRRVVPRSTQHRDEMMQMAASLAARGGQLDELRAGGARAAAVRDRNRADADTARAEVYRLSDDLGVPIDVAAPASATSMLSAWETVVAARHSHADAEAQLAELAELCATAERQLEEHRERTAAAVAAAGLPAGSPLERADELLSAYREAYTEWARARDAADRHRAALANYHDLTAVLGESVAAWSPDRVADLARTYQRQAEARHRHRETVRTVSAHLDQLREADPALGDLLDRELGTAELHTMVSTAEQEIKRLADERDALMQRIGNLDMQIEQLATADLLAGLAVERGALDERSDELAIAALSAAVAHRVLRGVAEEFEREHQPALIEATSRLARRVAPAWDSVMVRPTDDNPELIVAQRGGAPIPSEQLSTGARGLLYLALRIAMADHDAQHRTVAMPLICDDPLVHLDDERAAEAFGVLQLASESARQVLVFTCHERTVATAAAAGAAIVGI